MKIILALLAILAVPMSGYAAPLGWYWSIKAPNGSAPAVFGPYTDQTIGGQSYTGLEMCRDMLGSAQNAHGWSCHLGWTQAGCAIVKDAKGAQVLGFGYPIDYGPIPPNPKLVSDDCYQAPIAGGLVPGWYLPFFHADGSVTAEKCSSLGHIIQLHKLNPKNKIGHYTNLKCPNAPCITSNVSTACN